MSTWHSNSLARSVVVTSAAMTLLLAATAHAAPSMHFSITLPEEVRTGQVVVAAEVLTVNAGVLITGAPDSAVVHMGALPFVGVGGVLPNLYTVGGATITLSQITRNVYSEGPVLGVLNNIGGAIDNGPFGRRQSAEIDVQFPESSSGNITAWGPLANIALAPGRYNDVAASLLGKVRLRAGVYYLRSLTSSATGTIEIDTSAGPVEIYVTDALNLAGTTSGNAAKILMAYTGTAPASIGGNFNGTVLAPNAGLTMAGGLLSTLSGSFFAKAVILAPTVRVVHKPSYVFDLVRIARAVPSTSIIGYDPGYFGCAPSIDLPATWQTDASGRQYFQNLSYPANPSPCQASISSCDANDTPIPRPTTAQLNAAPAPGSQCAAIGSAVDAAECTINPATVTTLCAAGCQANEVCGSICLDQACTQTEARCGKLFASCTPMAAASNCETYYQCTDADSKGTFTSAQSFVRNPPQSAPGPNSSPDDVVSVSQHAILGDVCEPYGEFHPATVSEGGGAVDDQGGAKWGVSFTPHYGARFTKSDLGKVLANGEFEAEATAGLRVDARVMGREVTALNAQAGAIAGHCGVSVFSEILLFGEQIASWDPESGASWGLENLGDDQDTPEQDKDACVTAYEARKAHAGVVRHANFVARAALAHYNLYGVTDDLCAEANAQLNGGWNCDMAPYQPDQSLSIIEEWGNKYETDVETYVAFDAALKGNLRDNIATSGQLSLFNIRQAYTVLAAEATIPLGPMTGVVAVEAFGFWEIHGSVVAHVSYGLGYGDFWDQPNNALRRIRTPEIPTVLFDNDLRLAIGPVVEPGIGFTALAYVGVGFGPISVGIEGQVDIIRASLPAAVMANVARVSVPNVRPTVEEPWAGDPIPGIPFNTGMEWKTNLTGEVGLRADVLNGRINLAARVNLWFWSKTWRMKIADFTGYSMYLPLWQGSLGDPVVSVSSLGTEAENVEYTFIRPPAAPVQPDPNAPPFPIPFTPNECNVVE